MADKFLSAAFSAGINTLAQSVGSALAQSARGVLQSEIAKQTDKTNKLRMKMELIEDLELTMTMLESELDMMNDKIKKQSMKVAEAEEMLKIEQMQRDQMVQDREKINAKIDGISSALNDTKNEIEKKPYVHQSADNRIPHSKRRLELEKQKEESRNNYTVDVKFDPKDEQSGSGELYQFLNTPTIIAVITFDEIAAKGPPHDRMFHCRIGVNFKHRNLNIYCNGWNRTKKVAKGVISGAILRWVREWDVKNDITICGDVELNPGPRFSRMTATSAEGLQYKIQMKQARKNYRRDKNRENKGLSREDNSQPYELKIHEDIDFNPKSRTKYFRKQIDEKNKRMERDYRSKHKKLKTSPYSGNFRDDLKQFWAYLDDHGYASNQAHKLPPWFIQRIFEKWARDGKLIKTQSAHVIWIKTGTFIVSNQYMPQYKARKLLLSAFVADNYGDPRFEYLRLFISKTTQMPNNIGITLKDIDKANKRIKQKGARWHDMARAVPQMRKTYYEWFTGRGDVRIPDSRPEMWNSKLIIDPPPPPKPVVPETWLGGTIRSVGRKLAEGIQDVVMPILDKVGTSVKQVFSMFPDLSTIHLIVKIIGICVLVAIIGWAMVTVARSITMGIESMCAPLEFGDDNDFSAVTVQAFGFHTVKAVSTGWLESLDNGISRFNKAFSDAEITKCVKKIGDFSAAVKNVEWLVNKIKEIFCWCVNATCRLLFDRPFFQDARNVQALETKIVALVKVCQEKDISQMSDNQKIDFVAAYQDLTEMYPLVFRVDKHLGGQIKACLAGAITIYKQCIFYMKTNIARMEPYYIAIEGLAGQGKTNLSDHFCKMIYDCMRIKSPRIFSELFYKGADGPYAYNSTLIYNRQAEQEYWDNYNNQPITKLDDLGQAIAAETRAAEFFSIIRMVNCDPYPLHMADILRKDNTVFSSFLVITTTNMCEKLFKKPGELQIVEPKAYLRRRDISIHCSRTDKWIKQGIQSKEYLEEFALEVYRPSKMTGEEGQKRQVNGYAELVDLVDDITTDIIARHQTFTTAEKMDHTGVFAQCESVLRELQRTNVTNAILDHLSEEDDSSDEGIGVLPDKEPVLTSSEHVPKITTVSEEKIFRPYDTFKVERVKQIKISRLTDLSKDEDMSEAKKQMFMSFILHDWNYRDLIYGVHPSTKNLLRKLGKNVQSYDEAQIAIQELRDKHPFFSSEGWEHEFIVHGVTVKNQSLGESRLSVLFKYNLGFFSYYQQPMFKTVIKDMKEAFPDIDDYHVDFYIGLTNPLYWKFEKQKITTIFLNNIGSPPIFFDDVCSLGVEFVDLNMDRYRELIYYEIHNETSLRATRGKSHLRQMFVTFSLVLASFVGLAFVIVAAVTLFRRLDPSRKIDTEFVSIQSSDPRLNKMQRNLARARNLPKERPVAPKNENFSGAKKQFMDDNARSLLPILRKNTYLLRGIKGREEFGVHAFGIEGSIFEVPAHFLHERPEKIYLSQVSGEKEYEFLWDTIKYQLIRPIGGLSSADMALVYFPMTQFVRTVTHLLFHEKDDLHLAQGIGREIKTDSITDDEGNTIDTYEVYHSPDPIRVCNSSNYEGQDRRVEQIAKFKINYKSENGDCGIPYIFFNPALQQKIGYFHIADLDGFALAGRINVEDVENFKKYLDSNLSEAHAQIMKLKIDMNPHILERHQLKYEYVPDQGIFGLEQIGKLSHKFHYPQKSQILSTPMCKDTKIEVNGEIITKKPPFPVETEPALLRTKGDLDPLKIGFESCQNRKIIYGNYLQPEDYNGIFNDALRNATGRVLELWEVLKGVRNHPKSHSIKRNTSTAFYFKMFNKLKRDYIDLSKAEFNSRINKDEMIDVSHDTWLHVDVIDLLIMWVKKMNEGQLTLNWVIAMLKDEIRPKDRVAAGKTRIFYAGAFAFMIISRMAFGEFAIELETNWMDTDSAVGCNPYSADWRWIFTKAVKFGLKVKDDDTVKWDQHFPTTEFITTFPDRFIKFFHIKGNVVLDFIKEKIQVDHTVFIYAVTISNFHCAVVVLDKVLFLILQASGVDMTTLFNTICNSACNRCIIRIETNKPFDDVATMWVYGDDLLLNCPTVSRERIWYWAKILFNHTRTDPMKRDVIQDTEIKDCFFLMRQFRYDGVIMCPLNIKSINGMLQWIDKPKDKTFEKQFEINCKVALMEISRHGEQKFEEYKKEINTYLMQYGSSWVIHMTYERARQDIFFRATFC